MHASSHKVKQRTSLSPFGVKLLLLRALPYPAVRFHPGSKQSYVGRSASQSIALSDQKEQPAERQLACAAGAGWARRSSHSKCGSMCFACFCASQLHGALEALVAKRVVMAA